VNPEDEFIFEKEELIINENSVDEAQETEELEELAPSISSNEFKKNDYELEEPEISAQAESTEQPEVMPVEEAVEGMEKISMRGEWKPLEESIEISEPEAMEEASPEEIPFEAEVSQQERVPAGGPLTKVPAREIEKEAEVLEKAQQLLNQRDLKKSLDEYQKLIKKGKLLEGVIHDLREISYQYPVDVSVWQSLGDAYMKANQLQDALESYTKAEELLR
jgi:tetratricopeptide (TPR) repeat protein